VILVRNLQGSTWSVDNTGGSLITRIGLVTPQITGASNLSVVGTSGALTVGSPSPLWALKNPGGLGGPIELTAGVQPGQYRGGIAGCDASHSGFQSDYFQTCNGGWVQFSFTTTNDWSATNAQVAFLSQDFNNPPGAGIECDTQGGSPGREFCASNVTPEPVTMVLLGSGLFGVGGARLFRRRRRDALETD
jgi:hypothetical protein